MKNFFIVLFFLTFSLDCFCVDYVYKAQYTNSNIGLQPSGTATAIIPYKDGNPVNGQVQFGTPDYRYQIYGNNINAEKTIINGIETIPSNTYLDSSFFTGVDTSTLSLWSQLNANSYASGAVIPNYMGDGVMTAQGGTIYATTDHLGGQNALALDGSTTYLKITGYENYTGAITCGMKAQIPETTYNSGSPQGFLGIYGYNEGSNLNTSFVSNVSSSGTFATAIWNNNSYLTNGGFLGLVDVNDNNWHSYTVGFNNTNSTVSFAVDGVIRGYGYDSAITQRTATSTGYIVIGALKYLTGATNFIKMNVAEPWCVRQYLTPNQQRLVTAAGSGERVIKKLNGDIAIGNRKKAKIKDVYTSSIATLISGHIYRYLKVPESIDYNLDAFYRIASSYEDRGVGLFLYNSSSAMAHALNEVFNATGSPDYTTNSLHYSGKMTPKEVYYFSSDCSTSCNNNCTQQGHSVDIESLE